MHIDKTVLSSYPQRVVLELTNRCNMNCVMCGRNAFPFEFHDLSIPVKTFDPLLSTIEEVAFMGWGEPMVHPKFEDWLEYVNLFGARIYLITNGMKLDTLQELLEKYRVDVLAVSIDGAIPETNNRIRRGSDFEFIISNLIDIKNRWCFPYINFVFTAMKSNIHELPQLIKVAYSCGVEEVKVVYLTSFKNTMQHESLWNEPALVEMYFRQAIDVADSCGIALKLPYVQGTDVSGNFPHKPCYVGWRDLYIGCDGNVRPCQSSNIKLGSIDTDFSILWNSSAFQEFRRDVNFNLCSNCYQSSYANWNMKHAWFNRGEE